MLLSAIAPWFGGKRTLAPIIVEQLGPHSSYWEPFCGSMAVLLVKPPCRSETVNDLHGDLVNLARVIRDSVAGAAFYRRVRRVLFSQQLLRDARNELAESPGPLFDTDVDRAVAYFMNSWMGMNGLAGSLAGETNQRGMASTASIGNDPER